MKHLHPFNFNKSRRFFAATAALAASSSSAFGLISTQSLSVSADGQFTYSSGLIHYWTGSQGYSTYDVATGVTNTIGKPDGALTNGFGDPFGIYDSASGMFYGATYLDGGNSYIYSYNTSTSTWSDGVQMTNAYGGATYNNTLYVSGLGEPWNGGYGQSTFIFGFSEDGLHDALIETGGNSSYMAIAPNGDIYYARFDYAIASNNILYRWDAADVANVFNDLAGGAEDTFLTLANAEVILQLPGTSNGVAVDDAGNVFFTTNGSSSILGMVDDSSPDGYQTIVSSADDGIYGWYGPISIEGDFTEGDPLYFSPYGSIIEVTMQVPEPAHYALVGGLSVFGLVYCRKRKKSSASATSM
ncbi:hypothetical protein [Cerasicoccus frondis]|uniref:hypothetical protein n=1 Tax=Cerasicoccus frondis TaxID=490090 RepID=UPI002852928A|nr:hypothetical protein [Cerasicoccus frondis]